MKNTIRHWLWKFLGMRYFQYLEGQNKTYLHKAKNTTIGFKTYHNGAFVWQWYGKSSLQIGAYCSIANDVNFILDDGFHLSSEVTSFPHFNHLSDRLLNIGSQTQSDFKKNTIPKKSNIVIGNDVWIGMNAIVLPNTIVGNGVTIMAGAVVNGNIPDYAVIGGVPAKIIKMKHDEIAIQKMNDIAWWNWKASKVEKNVGDFYLPIHDFIDKWS